MTTTPSSQTPISPEVEQGAAMCSYCETAIKNHEGNLSDDRRKHILDVLASLDLGLTDKEQRAMGKCLAYFDHFHKGEADILSD
jgi:hypothetical protein